MENNIFEIIESALQEAGYKIKDGDGNSIIICQPNSEVDYIIHVRDINS